MAVNKKGLGKGLDSLIPNNRNVKPANPDISTEQVKQPELKSGEQMMKINMVEPNRDQPRKNFDPAHPGLESLLLISSNFSLLKNKFHKLFSKLYDKFMIKCSG